MAKRSTTRKKQNLFGFGAKKTTSTHMVKGKTRGQMDKLAYAAGQRSGDTAGFDSWAGKHAIGWDSTALRSFEQAYRSGVEVGGEAIDTPKGGKGRKCTASLASAHACTYKGVVIDRSGDGYTTSLDRESVHDSLRDAKRFVDSMKKNPGHTITLPDGRVFPAYDGEALSWDIGSYNSHAEQEKGYPKMRAVIRAMKEHRPEQLERERREMLKASFNQMFGHNAKKVLNVIEEETGKKNGTASGTRNPALASGVTVVSPEGKVRRVKNLGYIIKHWKDIESLTWESTGAPLHEGVFRADLRDGSVYSANYADFGVFQRFINRPVFRGLPIRVDGRLYNVGDVLRKSNPESEATNLYESFHGRPPAETIVSQFEEHEHSTLTGLGTLSELCITNIYGEKRIILCNSDGDPEQQPMDERVFVCSNENGTQIYFEAGDQELDLGKLGLKAIDINRDRVKVGRLDQISYVTEKKFDGFEPVTYFHKFGEDSKVKPDLMYDPLSERMHIVGGQYEIKAPGIIN